MHSDLAETLHSPSLPGQESAESTFCLGIFTFRRNQPIIFEILRLKFLQADKNMQISNFIGWFCLKDKLFEQKMDTSVSCHDTEGLWKV